MLYATAVLRHACLPFAVIWLSGDVVSEPPSFLVGIGSHGGYSEKICY